MSTAFTPASTIRCAATLAACCVAAAAHADTLMVTATVTNLAPANSISFAPLHVGYNNGTFDAFNLGQVANAATISVAEGGAGGAWQSAFAAADPTATRGTIGGLLQPGASSSLSLLVDPLLNPYFTFAAMAVPSNDFFIGNDNPQGMRLFDAAGALQLGSITVRARQIWDAGSEVFDPAASAFVGNNDLRAPQNSVVAFNFAELAAFNGLTTGAGYVFNSQLTADSAVYRIDFAVAAVPEPGSYAMLGAGLLAVAGLARRRRVLTAA
jgi:PEP-CTERM motif